MSNHSKMKLMLFLFFSLFIAAESLFQLKFPHENIPYTENLDNEGLTHGGIQYKILYYKQLVDHFSFSTADTFEQRYLYIDHYWDGNNGPIFFYTGNEGNIISFMNNTGLMFDWAPEFKALIIFAEHRYYGTTMPYGKESFKDPQHLGYLTAEQALADFVTLIDYIKSSVQGATNSPVVAFGGSYGGMLSAWMRMKYPRSIVGALAASAPIWYFEDITPCDGFNKVLTDAFKQANPNCPTNIRHSWDVIGTTASTPSGLKQLSEIFKLCKPLESADKLMAWLLNAWVYMGMVDYPYPASFLAPLPAWPVKVACGHLSTHGLNGTELLTSVMNAASVYYNWTGTISCFDLDLNPSPNLGDQGWGFQACSEMIMPMCADGVHDMFPPTPWNLPEYLRGCKQTYQIDGRPDWMVQQFGGKKINSASNIIFSNGKLDPWSAGGVLRSLSPSLVAILIENAAHHLDLRSANVKDPQSVVEARLTEKHIVRGWIESYYTRVGETWRLGDSIDEPSGKKNGCIHLADGVVHCAEHSAAVFFTDDSADRKLILVDGHLTFYVMFILIILAGILLLAATKARYEFVFLSKNTDLEGEDDYFPLEKRNKV